MKRGRDETDTHTGQGPSAQEAGRAGYKRWSADLSRGAAGGSAHLSAADASVNGSGVFDHSTPHDAARVVWEEGAARPVVHGAVTPLGRGSVAGEALKECDAVSTHSAQRLHDEGDDRVSLVYGIAVR